MCEKSYNRIGDFYKPFEDIFYLLKSPWTENADSRMTKIWTDYIGEKVFINTTAAEKKGILIQKVCDMFTSDPIGYRLMAELVLYKRNFDRIIVTPGADCTEMIGDIKTAKYPVPVLESCSNFATLISTDAEDEYVLHLKFWETKNSELHQYNNSSKNDEALNAWAQFTRDKLVLEATNSERKNNLRKTLNHLVTTDTRFVTEVINYKSEIARLTVKQNFVSIKAEKQSLADMVTLLKNAVNPVVMFSGEFAIVISTNAEDSPNMAMHIWDLKISI